MVLRVLLGEDDAQMRSLVANALRSEGFEVDEAADGEVMLERAATVALERGGRYDLVVSDVRMPAVDGFHIAATFRASDASVPVILMTAFGDDDSSARAAQLGVTMFYKPFKLAHLREVARRLVLGSSAQRGT